jgi:[ribosomal protein S5]-alanine N-acetyltransferase
VIKLIETSLATGRLDLRPMRMDDAESLFRIYSDPQFARYWSAEPWTSLSQASAQIENDLREMAAGERLRLGIFLRSRSVLIGTCSLFQLVPSCRRAELGYGIAREHWRHGYMFEAVSALVKLAFDDVGLNRLEADVDPRNTASVRSLEKLGFKHEGHLRERWIVGGETSDSAIYGLLAREYHCMTPLGAGS